LDLKRNIFASYISQIYVTVIGIVMTPLYISYMGAEAYGLVGVFATLQAVFGLLDMGLTPTIARESARYHGGVISPLEFRRLTTALEGLFAAVALLGGLLLFTLAHPIASRWLDATLPLHETTVALQLMALIVALRWMCGMYRGVITGAERLVWLSGFNCLISTGRFVLILPILIYISASAHAFFGFQLVTAILELGILAWTAHRMMPCIPKAQKIFWQWEIIHPILKFSLSIAFTSSLWVLVTQTDKLVLSHILPLADYGYFSVAVLASSAVMLVAGPISGPLLPRMTRLHASESHDDLISLYRKATRSVSATAIPFALVLILFAPQVLWAWTGDSDLVKSAAPVLSLYAAGYAFLVVGAFPYYLQYAKGNLRLHLIGSLMFMLLLIPGVIWAATTYGMTGAGWAWLLTNATYLIVWAPLVHNKFAPGLHSSWLLSDIGRPICLPFVFGILIAKYIPLPGNRFLLATTLATIGITFCLISISQAAHIQYRKSGLRFTW
jgi:O-antigen/teichoic acid export membrane protein